MPKQVRTPLIPSANGAAETHAAISRTIVQSFFEPDQPGPSNGPPTAGAGSAQVVDDARLTTRGTSLVRADAAAGGAPTALPDIAKGSREALPSLGPDAQSRDDDAWQTYSDVSFMSEGYLPGESPFDPPNSYPSGIGQAATPPQLTDPQKAAIDMILCGKKLKTIAEKLGIHPSTLWRWRRHDLDFRSTLALASQKALMHSIEQLRKLVPKAVEIVHSEMEHENFHAAIQVLRLVHRHLETYENLAS
jgi:transposase-like protein